MSSCDAPGIPGYPCKPSRRARQTMSAAAAEEMWLKASAARRRSAPSTSAPRTSARSARVRRQRITVEAALTLSKRPMGEVQVEPRVWSEQDGSARRRRWCRRQPRKRDSRSRSCTYSRQPVRGVSTQGAIDRPGSAPSRFVTRFGRCRANGRVPHAQPSPVSGGRTRCTGGTSPLRRTTRCSHDPSRSSRSSST
jgi:hypothetical protein